MYKVKDKNGFTLIEILVVIAIIGLLASIVLVSLTITREKGRLAAAQSFAAQVNNVAGDKLVGGWDFDDCSGTTAVDGSGFNDNGTLINAPTWSTDAPFGTGCSLSFNGSNNSVRFNFPTSLVTMYGQLTFSAWVKTSVSTGVENNILQIGGSYNNWALYIDSVDQGKPSLSITGNYNARLIAKTNVKDGLWHYVVGAFDGSAAKIYIDGKLENSATKTLLSQSGTLVSGIGANNDGSDRWNGNIDSVHIFSKDLTASAVQKLYAEEAPLHRVAYGK